jgi:hypothetical protein
MRQTSAVVALVLLMTACVACGSQTLVATASPSASPIPSPVGTPVAGDVLDQGSYWAGAVAHAGGYVAIAWPAFLTSDSDATVWTSVDLQGNACPEGLAASGSVVVAVGSIGTCHSGGGFAPAAWYSPDGKDWSSAWINDPEERAGTFSGVVAGPAGFVAWGYVGNILESFEEDPVFQERYAAAPWVSPDGMSWAPLADRRPFARSRLTNIVNGGPGLVAMGYVPATADQASRPVIWTSADGEAWNRIDAGLPFVEAQQQISIGGSGSHLIVWSLGDDGVTRLWTSMDGVTWEAMPDLPVPAYDSVSGIDWLGDRLIAFGAREVAEPGISLPCRKDQVLANQCHQAAMIMLGGPDWAMLPESAIPDGTSIVGMVANQSGLLAFGAAPEGPAIWSSADGHVWNRLSLSLANAP